LIPDNHIFVTFFIILINRDANMEDSGDVEAAPNLGTTSKEVPTAKETKLQDRILELLKTARRQVADPENYTAAKAAGAAVVKAGKWGIDKVPSVSVLDDHLDRQIRKLTNAKGLHNELDPDADTSKYNVDRRLRYDRALKRARANEKRVLLEPFKSGNKEAYANKCRSGEKIDDWRKRSWVSPRGMYVRAADGIGWISWVIRWILAVSLGTFVVIEMTAVVFNVSLTPSPGTILHNAGSKIEGTEPREDYTHGLGIMPELTEAWNTIADSPHRSLALIIMVVVYVGLMIRATSNSFWKLFKTYEMCESLGRWPTDLLQLVPQSIPNAIVPFVEAKFTWYCVLITVQVFDVFLKALNDAPGARAGSGHALAGILVRMLRTAGTWFDSLRASSTYDLKQMEIMHQNGNKSSILAIGVGFFIMTVGWVITNQSTLSWVSDVHTRSDIDKVAENMDTLYNGPPIA
jgi:hypothetical protein